MSKPQKTDEEIWTFCILFDELKNKKIPLTEFAKIKGVERRSLQNMKRFFLFLKEKDYEKHKELIEIVRFSKSKNIRLEKSAADNNVKHSELVWARNYINFQKKLKRIYKEKGVEFVMDEALEGYFWQKEKKEKLEFVPLTKEEPSKNLEFKISDELSITVASDIKAEKLIKIINLLKDL